MVEIKLPNGERRQGQVLDTSQGLAVVQVFGQTLGLTTTGTSIGLAITAIILICNYTKKLTQPT